LSEDRDLDWNVVRENPNKSWDWSSLSLNPNITWDIVQQNPEMPWNWEYLSENKMEFQNKIWAVRRIEFWWLDKMYNPKSKYVTNIKNHFESLCFNK